MNTLYYGDNLVILRELPAASVDLIYLDPPFNSNRSYNVLFKDEAGKEADAQLTAFDDTWHWNQKAEETYHQLVTLADEPISRMIEAMRHFIGANQMMAYLVMMAARLVELHRVLKPSGSLYLHCDPTASHYLKSVLDTIFGVQNFRNEIIWRRADPKGHAFTKYPSTHDVMLFYSKTATYTWHSQYRGYDDDYLESHYNLVEEGTGRQYTLSDCTNPNKNRPNLTYEWNGLTRVWRWTKERMQRNHDEGRLVYTQSGMPRYKRYLDEMQGTPVTTIWDDIPFINSQAAERLGYPTQKPVALLKRILAASSNPGDVVLDPFCGCGTTIAASQKLGRQWIGIDITHLSIALQKYRLRDSFGLEAGKDYAVKGEPVDYASAVQLAHDDRYQFQWWALSLIQARPVGGEAGSKTGKKGADQGVDGVITFIDDAGGKVKRVVVQVKSGGVTSAMVRDLVGTVQREQSAIGVLISLEPPSKPMRLEAAKAGFYTSPGWRQDYPRIQLLTIQELLDGATVKMPPAAVTFKQAGKESGASAQQAGLEFS